ncbi:MAG: hypothetical protein IKW48_09045 [Akkermansia sp.]|nr:hypothetical protein [Akkermansia sp.]MBR5888330.1 hypothetical protein [Akkermansia sp.]
MIFTIAKATGWTEEYIMWMPLRKTLQYLHASWLSEGVATEWRSVSEDEAREAESLFNRLKYLTRHG